MIKLSKRQFLGAIGTPLIFANACSPANPPASGLLNASFDPTRELFMAYNRAFQAQQKKSIRIMQSHSGSGKQARAVIDGLQANVVTLANAYDINKISESGLIAADWAKRLSHNSVPYFSTIVFLVRKSNPKSIKDWSDLARPDLKIITPNPKTSGGARWNYLAGLGYGLRAHNNDEVKAIDFVKTLYSRVEVLDTGARGATMSFVERQQGDVLIAWESDALMSLQRSKDGEFEIIYPSLSVRCDTPVAWVDKVVEKQGNLELCKAYLGGLYEPEAQKLIAQYHFRPQDQAILQAHSDSFKTIEMLEIERDFGGWKSVHNKHFATNGIFDTIQNALHSASPEVKKNAV